MKYFCKILFVLLALAPLSVFAQTGDFESITAVPAFDAIKATGDGGNLAGFFNQLYILAVGACAIIAVAQIMIAGFRLATAGGSHSTIEEARNSIQNTVLGLLLVLSPTIVFGVINPDILNLKIDTGILDMASTSEATSPDAFSGDGSNVAITLRGNKWGALDNVCDFKAGTGAFLGFHVPQEIPVKDLGNGVSVSQGRQCCVLSGGTLKQITVENVSGTQEVCDFQPVFESKKYVAHIVADVTRLVKDDAGVIRGKPRIAHFFTSGGGSGSFFEWYQNGKRTGDSWFGDVDTQMIHSFRSKSSCESFINGLTNESLFDNFKNRRMFPPAIGLLEAENTLKDRDAILNLNWGSSEEMLPSTLGEVEKIFDRWCDEITISKK